jgi:phospholipid transport system substrate-binding protein
MWVRLIASLTALGLSSVVFAAEVAVDRSAGAANTKKVEELKKNNTAETSLSVLAVSENPHQFVEKATQQMLLKVKAGQKLTGKEKEAYFYKLVEDEVAPFVDFDLIAERVMGKDGKKATPAQIKAFSQVFRETLIGNYAVALTTYQNQSFKMTPFEGVKQAKGKMRASVTMEIKNPTDASVVPIQYALYRQLPTEAWKLENLVIKGINFGLTYRNQFAELAKKHQGNIDKVIANWTVSDVSQVTAAKATKE